MKPLKPIRGFNETTEATSLKLLLKPLLLLEMASDCTVGGADFSKKFKI
jgi:hypothetical protein